MEIKEAVNIIWQNRRYESASVTEVLSHLNEEVAESLKAMLKNDRLKAQHELEDALSCLFIAFHMLGIDPEEAVKRQIDRMNISPEKTMYIFPDRVEIRVGNNVKGGWAIWSAEDLAEALKVAQEFNCKVIKEDFFETDFSEEADLDVNNG